MNRLALDDQKVQVTCLTRPKKRRHIEDGQVAAQPPRQDQPVCQRDLPVSDDLVNPITTNQRQIGRTLSIQGSQQDEKLGVNGELHAKSTEDSVLTRGKTTASSHRDSVSSGPRHLSDVMEPPPSIFCTKAPFYHYDASIRRSCCVTYTLHPTCGCGPIRISIQLREDLRLQRYFRVMNFTSTDNASNGHPIGTYPMYTPFFRVVSHSTSVLCSFRTLIHPINSTGGIGLKITIRSFVWLGKGLALYGVHFSSISTWDSSKLIPS